MMNRFWCFIPFLFMMGLAQAQVVADLNVATVPVKNASASARHMALPKALGQVLVKMSGNPGVMTLPAIQNAIENANALIQSYNYTHQDQPDGQAHLMLQFRFGEKAVRQLLRDAGQADWPNDRPLVLLWLKIHSDNGVEAVSNTNDGQLLQQVTQLAKQRGLPILLPAMDLQDQSYVNTDNTKNFDLALLKQAATRYAAATILAGNIQKTDDKQWQGKWLLLMNDMPYRWRNTATTEAALLTQAVNDVANLVANQLSVADKKDLQTTVTVDVSHIANLDDYAKVLSILRHLTPVANVTVQDMNGTELRINIKTIGGVQALSHAIVSSPYFAAIENPEEGHSPVDLWYRWEGARPINNSDQGVDARS